MFTGLDSLSTFAELAGYKDELLEFLEKANAETGEMKIRGPYYRLLDDIDNKK